MIDLDDLLPVTAGVEGDAEFADAVRWRFRHLLVDEAQDLNPAQYRILACSSAGAPTCSWWVIRRRPIYGFNGSDPRLLTEVDRHLPGIEVDPPADEPPLHAAGRRGGAATCLDRGGASRSRRWCRHGPTGRPVEIIVAADERDEAALVAATVGRTAAARRVKAGAIAVLARTHEQLAGLRRAFEHAGVPVQRNAHGHREPARRGQSGRQPPLTSASQLRAWAHDVIDMPPRHGANPCRRPSQAERRVAAAVLDFLREAAARRRRRLPLVDGVDQPVRRGLATVPASSCSRSTPRRVASGTPWW